MTRILALLACIAAGAGGLSACHPPPPADARVLILGDSLTAEAHRSGEADARLGRYRVDWAGSLFGGAPCNGRKTAADTAYRPDVVVIAYSGNANGLVDNCMNGETGRALVDRYVADVGALISRYDNGHTRVVVVGAPVRLDRRAETDAVFDALRRLAARRGVAFVDGGTRLTAHRVFRPVGRCLPEERVCGTASPGHNTLRAADGVHFCPAGPDFFGNCSGYSSGAVRFTLALRDAIDASTVAA